MKNITEKNKLSVVIPCFNEEINIILVLRKLKSIVQKTECKVEFIIVDGASEDNTANALKQQIQHLNPNHFKLILKKEKGGYGGDIMDGLSHATGDVLAWTHADMQTDPSDIITAYELYLKEGSTKRKVIIKGERINRGLLEVFFTFGMQVIVFFYLKVYLSDINAQPKLFSRLFYEKHLKKDHPTDFSLDLFALYQAKKNKYIIKTFPVCFSKRLYGEAKGGGGGWKNRFDLIKRTYLYIRALRAGFVAPDK